MPLDICCCIPCVLGGVEQCICAVWEPWWHCVGAMPCCWPIQWCAGLPCVVCLAAHRTNTQHHQQQHHHPHGDDDNDNNNKYLPIDDSYTFKLDAESVSELSFDASYEEEEEEADSHTNNNRPSYTKVPNRFRKRLSAFRRRSRSSTGGTTCTMSPQAMRQHSLL